MLTWEKGRTRKANKPRWRITGVKHRVVFGARESINQILAKQGLKIKTAFIERLNLDFHQHVAQLDNGLIPYASTKRACISS